MKKIIVLLLACLLTVSPAACGGNGSEKDTSSTDKEEENKVDGILKMTIGGAEVLVDWEDNASVDALRELASGGPLTVQMSMYGGFEQVGSLGAELPRDDKQTVTESGDIVLYSGDQIVVFYGSNSWAYTRLGHITDKTPEKMTQLLSGGGVTITLTLEQ